MTTSGQRDISVTRNEVILAAFEDMGVYAPGAETPEASEISSASLRLNMMIKAWQAAGAGLWLNQAFSLTLTASTQSYLFGPSGTTVLIRPLAIVEARVRNTAGTDSPLYAMSRDEYMMLSLKSSTGKTTQYYYDPQLVNGVFYVWPVNYDTTETVVGTMRVPIQTFTAIADTPDFPQEWFDALHYGLAARLSAAYRVDMNSYQRLKELAKVTYEDAMYFDREQEVSVFLQVAER